MIRVPTREEQARHRASAQAAHVLFYLYAEGDEYTAFRRDAEVCERYAWPDITAEDEDGVLVFRLPSANLQRATERLVAAGYRVAVLDWQPQFVA